MIVSIAGNVGAFTYPECRMQASVAWSKRVGNQRPNGPITFALITTPGTSNMEIPSLSLTSGSTWLSRQQ